MILEGGEETGTMGSGICLSMIIYYYYRIYSDCCCGSSRTRLLITEQAA